MKGWICPSCELIMKHSFIDLYVQELLCPICQISMKKIKPKSSKLMKGGLKEDENDKIKRLICSRKTN